MSETKGSDEERAGSDDSPTEDFRKGSSTLADGSTFYADNNNSTDDGIDEENAPLQCVVNEWAQETSIHGVPFVTDVTLWKFWKRALWLCLVLTSTAFMLWQITQLIRQYHDYDVETGTVTMYPECLPYPQVTLCSLNAFSKRRMDATDITDPRTQQEFDAISPPITEFILYTEFNGVPLNVEEVWKPHIVDEDTGRCWSFVTNEEVRQAGYAGGLAFTADINQTDNDPQAKLAGVALWLTQPGTLIDNQVQFLTLNPGKQAAVNINKCVYSRVEEKPWSHCHSQAPDYTQARCRSECLFAHTRKKCGCHRYGDTTNAVDENTGDPLLFCQRLNPKDRACLAQVRKMESEILQDCDCGSPSCSQEDFNGYVTEVDRANSWIKQFDESKNLTEDYVMRNYVWANVNYCHIRYELTQETKSVTFSELLGSIGGSMGFFLGISMLSVFEVFGDLTMLRLVPRAFGHRNLYGVGSIKRSD